MRRTNEQLREDAVAIWRAGLAAVDSRQLVLDNVSVDDRWLRIGDEKILLDDCRRMVVVGAGKAGAGMAQGIEELLGPHWLAKTNLTGWINVPADCVRTLQRIQLHAARPAGLNEPTEEGVQGAERILKLVSSLTKDDLCLCLMSGGGSALLPAPAVGVTLADKQAITKHLSASGANIQELNTVRKQLSRIKGGKLAQACKAGRLITLIISDVLGDPLDVIGSGPTVADTATPADALQVLARFRAREAGVSPAVFEFLEQAASTGSPPAQTTATRVTNLVIGNNATAVDAAGVEAERRGYSHAMVAATQLEGLANDVGRHHAQMAFRMLHEPGPDCLITGGEPTVQLADSAIRGQGGRNQQLVLSALATLENELAHPSGNPLEGIALLSGGTDGEDGPTDAAGALVDAAVYASYHQQQLDATTSLERNDAYPFFQRCGGLLKTGPTHTNVCDVRVVVVARRATSEYGEVVK